VCSVSVIAVNKAIFSVLGFRFVMFLSAVHFFAGAGLLQVLASFFNAFEHKQVAQWRVYRLALAGALSILSANFSLRFNAMGTYQILKTAVLPTVMAMSVIQKRGMPSHTDLACAALVVIGSCMAVMSDLTVTYTGAMIGIFSVIITAQYQIWSGSEQKDLGLSPTQVMFASALPQACMTLAASVVLETSLLYPVWGLFSPAASDGAAPAAPSPSDDVLAYPWSMAVVGYIALSALFAVGLNYSSFAILGKTSPTTMQIVNQTKTVLIIAADFIFFPKPGIEGWRLAVFIFAIALVVGGATWYGLSTNVAKQPPATAAPSVFAGGGAATPLGVPPTPMASGGGNGESTGSGGDGGQGWSRDGSSASGTSAENEVQEEDMERGSAERTVLIRPAPSDSQRLTKR
jgi:solute carrier family 35 protein E3